jgi:enoyl-[acyl-carrier protein] reductase II
VELTTRFTRAYGLTTPIAQAGMAFVGTTPDLAVVVSNAGALGSLAVGLMPARVLQQTIDATRYRTVLPFNVNFITIFTDQEQIDTVVAAGVAVASFHWGHPPPAWIDQLHSAGSGSSNRSAPWTRPSVRWTTGSTSW